MTMAIPVTTKSKPSPIPKCLFQNETGWRPLRGEDDEDAQKDVEQANQMLKERLGNALLSQNLLLLFGSGASVAVGGPSMPGLWQKAAQSQKAVFTEVCQAVGHPPEIHDIESLLSRCQSALAFRAGQTETIKSFIKAVEDIIRDDCRNLSTWTRKDGTAQTALEVVAPHVALLSRVVPRKQELPRTRIFTTNYDLCLEVAAKERRMPILDGFDLIAPQNFDGRWFDYDFVRRNERDGAPDYLESVFHLYKLHGSVDWHRSKDGIIRDAQTDAPYLIYPREQKFALAFEQGFLEMMARFQMALREKDTTLIVIGFGFNDHHLNAPLYNALATNPHFKLIIADYSPEAKLVAGGTWDVLWRLQQSGAPLDIVQMDFAEFPNHLPTYSQARANNTQEKAAQLLKVLSTKG